MWVALHEGLIDCRTANEKIEVRFCGRIAGTADRAIDSYWQLEHIRTEFPC